MTDLDSRKDTYDKRPRQTDYAAYIGKRVTLLLAARGVCGESNPSISIDAKIVSDFGFFVNLEDIVVRNISGCNESSNTPLLKGNYKKAKIDKRYLIGVFEE